MIVHLNSKESVCDKCSKIFPSRNKLFQHVRSEHSEHRSVLNQLAVYQSDICKSLGFDVDDLQPESKKLKLSILTALESELLLVLIKPQGLSTMGEKPSLLRDPVLLLPGALQKRDMPYKKAIPCHRLDKDTGGLIICSKTFETEVRVRWCFRTKLARKRYRAIVIGKVVPGEFHKSNYGMINIPLSGKPSDTLFEVISYTDSIIYGCLTTLDLWPITGRKHQLRRHLQSIGHPILGDNIYITSTEWPASTTKLCLWALQIDIPDPKYDFTSYTGEISHSSPKDDDSDEEGENQDVGDEKNNSCKNQDIRGILQPSVSLSREDFFDIIQNAYRRRLISALENHVDISQGIDKHIINVIIEEPVMFDIIRRSHQAGYDDKKTIQVLP